MSEYERGHPFSTYAKFFQKLTFRTCAYQGVRNISFSENFACVRNGWPQMKKIIELYLRPCQWLFLQKQSRLKSFWFSDKVRNTPLGQSWVSRKGKIRRSGKFENFLVEDSQNGKYLKLELKLKKQKLSRNYSSWVFRQLSRVALLYANGNINNDAQLDIKRISEIRHYVESVQIWSFFWSVFSLIGLNTERYSVSLRIQSECGEIRTRKYSAFGYFLHNGRV